jgi:hypothetical protein
MAIIDFSTLLMIAAEDLPWQVVTVKGLHNHRAITNRPEAGYAK